MKNTIFTQFIVILSCFVFLIGAAAVSPTATPENVPVVDARPDDGVQCRGEEVWDELTQSCLLQLDEKDINDLDKVITGGISGDDLAARLIADDQSKPRVDPDSEEEVKKKEADYANKNKVVKAEDQDLVSKTTGLSAQVIIPKIKISAPIVFTTGKDIQTGDWACLGPACPMRFKLAKGVLHIAGYPEPGEIGNSVISGHSSAYASEPGGYKTVFAKLNQVGVGDTFEIRMSNKKVLKYRVFESFEFKLSDAVSNNPSAEATAQANKRNIRSTERSIVTLETCWPVGSNRDRWIVQGELI